MDEDDYVNLSFCVLQQAFNATVAINHMKKLQLAHGDTLAKQSQTQTQLPDIKVISTSHPEATDNNLVHDNLEPNGNLPSHMPSVSMETKMPMVSHSVTLTVTEKAKHVYHSEPRNLNGYQALLVRELMKKIAMSNNNYCSLYYDIQWYSCVITTPVFNFCSLTRNMPFFCTL